MQCQKCNTEIREGAKFCDSCGAPVAPGAEAPNEAAPANQTNWTAIIVVVVVVAVLGWLLFGPNGGSKNAAPGGNQTMASGENPHGGGMQASGAMDSEMSAQITEAKDKLKENPLDVESLQYLYQMFGMIGRQGQITEYLNAGVEELKGKSAELGEEETLKSLDGLVAAAVSGFDPEGAVSAMEQFVGVYPENHELVLKLADLCSNVGNIDGTITWNTKLLETIDVNSDAEKYWKAKLFRAAAYAERGVNSGSDEDVAMAVSELKDVTLAQPDDWSAWFTLGRALGVQGEVEAAEAALNSAKDKAPGPNQIWQVEAALAELRGEEPPPAPSTGDNPHGGMGSMEGTEGMGGGEMANPHGGMGGGSEGGAMPNPHGGM